MGTEPRTFTSENLAGATFRDSTLRGAVMRGVDVEGLEIEAPWLLEEPGSLLVNGVDVAPLVDAELDRRFPGRALRRAETADEMREAWAAVERAWADAVRRAEAMPPDALDASVGGEWSFAQTVRHLVMATDMWLGRGILQREKPFHPLGQPDASYAEDGEDLSVFSTEKPTWEQVREAREDRQRMVGELMADLTGAQLDEERPNPHAPEHTETVRACLRTILEEEWEHLRYATRDLDALTAEEGR